MKPILFAALLALLSACSGGGGGSSAPSLATPVASALSFPFQSGYKSLIASGISTKNFTISGTCSGSGGATAAPATTPATFDGAAALSAASTVTMSFTNCAPASAVATTTGYYDSNYIPLGQSIPGTAYIVFSTPFAMPIAVTVGSTGNIGTAIEYTDSTKTNAFGSLTFTYLVEPDTASTAIVNLIEKSFEAPPCTSTTVPCTGVLSPLPPTPSVLAWTGQTRYRINAQGTLTPISIDIQYANGQTRTLTYN